MGVLGLVLAAVGAMATAVTISDLLENCVAPCTSPHN
jgi:hypothetical protein